MARRLADSIWLRPEPKGRQPSLSRSQIAGAALAIADAEGFEQVTMRRVAARLRSGTMTLYHYVRTKDDLVALMDDALMAQVLVPSAELSKGWREAISAIARKTRAVFAQHSWALVSMQLAPPGPNAMEHFEQCLAALADAPLEPADKLVLLGSVDDLAFGSALRGGGADAASSSTAPPSGRSESSASSSSQPAASHTSRHSSTAFPTSNRPRSSRRRQRTSASNWG